MTTNDPFMVRAQFGVIFFYAIVFAATLILFMFLKPQLDEFSQGVFVMVIGILGALVQQQSSYIFARQRPNEPSPGETTVTTTPATTTVTTAAAPVTTETTITPAPGGPTHETTDSPTGN